MVGILATGAIATTFTESLLRNDFGPNFNVQVVAVVSRDVEKATQFANLFSKDQPLLPIKPYENYEQFFADSSIDIVYVASPHYYHYEHCKMALQ